MYSSENIDVRNWVHLFESRCIKVCVQESFIFFEEENECETERFNSEFASMKSVVSVSPLCTTHVQYNCRLWSDQAIWYYITVCMYLVAQRYGKTVSCALLKVLFDRLPAQSRMSWGFCLSCSKNVDCLAI